jgi:hypothetical protein
MSLYQIYKYIYTYTDILFDFLYALFVLFSQEEVKIQHVKYLIE